MSTPYNARYKWAVVAMLWWIAFFNYADRQAIFSVFPLLESEMHLDKVQLGLLGSSFALVYGICAPFAGNIVDRVRRKTAVLGGLWAWSSFLLPNRGIDLGKRVQPLPADGTVPGLPEWRWIHTPGHSPGHVSLFREQDRTLIPGDAFVTVKQESFGAC